MTTIFEDLKEFLNENIYTSVYRQDIIRRFGNASNCTIDSYRRTLELSGYLFTQTYGIYYVQQKLPDKPLNYFKELAYESVRESNKLRKQKAKFKKIKKKKEVIIL